MHKGFFIFLLCSLALPAGTDAQKKPTKPPQRRATTQPSPRATTKRPTSRPSVNTLIGRLRTYQHRAKAQRALQACAPGCIPALVRALCEHKNRAVRLAIAATLIRIGPSTLPRLLPRLRSPVWRARANTLYVLSHYLKVRKKLYTPITKLLSDPHWWVRRNALHALNKLRLAPKRLVPLAARMLKETHKDARLKAVNILLTHRAHATYLIPRLLARLSITKKPGQYHIRRLLYGLDKRSPAAWFRELKHKNTQRRLYALSRIESAYIKPPKGAVPTLLRLTRDAHPDLRAGALSVLRKHLPQEVVPWRLLIPRLQDRAAKVRVQALRSAQARGYQAIPILAQATKDPNADVRVAALSGLSRFGGWAQPYLHKALFDRSPNVRREAFYKLRSITISDASLVQTLCRFSYDPQARIRYHARAALRKVHEDALHGLYKKLPLVPFKLQSCLLSFLSKHKYPPARKLLRTWLRSKHHNSRKQALEHLQHYGKAAVIALPSLRRLLRVPNLQHSALRVLHAIGPKAGPAVADILPLLHASDASLVSQALTTLHSIADARHATLLLPSLQRLLLQNEPFRLRIALILPKLGAKIVKPLLRFIATHTKANTTTAWNIHAILLHTFRKMGQHASDASDYVARLIRSKHTHLSTSAIKTIQYVEPSAQRQLALLTKVIKHDKRKWSRGAAILALGSLGHLAQPTLPLLLQELEQGGTYLKYRVAQVLPQITTPTPATVQALFYTIQGCQRYYLLQSLIQTLGHFAKTSSKARKKLFSIALGDFSPRHKNRRRKRNARYFALHQIEKLRKAHTRTVPILMRLCLDPHPGLQRHAIQALGKIGSEASISAPMLSLLLKSKSRTIRQEAALSLSSIEAPKAIIPMLLDMLFQSYYTRRRARKALVHYGEEVLPPLLARFQHKLQTHHKRNFLATLQILGPLARSASPQVLRLTRDPSLSIRRQALATLSAIKAPPKLALPVLIRALSDANPGIRNIAHHALKHYGKAAVPALLDALQEERIRNLNLRMRLLEASTPKPAE